MPCRWPAPGCRPGPDVEAEYWPALRRLATAEGLQHRTNHEVLLGPEWLDLAGAAMGLRDDGRLALVMPDGELRVEPGLFG
jgi:hypothetical protein